MSLIDKVHEMYKNDKVTKDILGACEKLLTELENSITDIERQRLLNFTTWYLEQIENELAITEKESTFEKRCDAVRVKLLTRGRVSIDNVIEMCRNYADYAKVVYNAKAFTINITLSKDITASNLNKLKNEVRAYVPAHILIEYADYARTHGELKAFTHQKLSEYTHGEIRDKGVL